jgi:hypothetical protein
MTQWNYLEQTVKFIGSFIVKGDVIYAYQAMLKNDFWAFHQ